MNVEEVGKWRFCPSCGRPVMKPEFASENIDSELFNFEDIRCSCCERPWIACPCTPATEGECRSIIHEPSNVKLRGCALLRSPA